MGRMLMFVPARWRIPSGDIGAGETPRGSTMGMRAGFERVGWRMLAFDGARDRRVAAPGGGMLCARPPGVIDRSMATGLAANGSEGRGETGCGARALEGPGLEGNGTLSMLGRPLDLAGGLRTRSGLLSELLTLKEEADDGARGRPVGCGGGAGLFWRGAGLFWRKGVWARGEVGGGLRTVGVAATRLWSLCGRSAATERGD